MKHNWEFNGIDIHKHEYWYKCKNCGSQDWIASYGTLDQLYPKECVAKKQHNKLLTTEPTSDTVHESTGVLLIKSINFRMNFSMTISTN